MYTIQEIHFGLVQLPNTKALTIISIKDVLLRWFLPIASCIGQAYNGAACMSAAQTGVQALMKEVDHCLYVNCFEHSLSLSI